MDASQSLPELVTAAKANAKTFEDRMLEASKVVDAQATTGAGGEELRSATQGLKDTAIDIFSVFEARMQHHFKRGPFSRKLRSLLADAGEAELADRVYQYYLMTNVLKHGKGASYRELLDTPTTLFTIKTAEGGAEAAPVSGEDLIDVTAPGFFDGLADTILEAFNFLEKR